MEDNFGLLGLAILIAIISLPFWVANENRAERSSFMLECMDSRDQKECWDLWSAPEVPEPTQEGDG